MRPSSTNVLRGEFLLQPKWVVLVEIGVIFGSALALGLALRRARGLMAAAVAYLLVGLYLGGTQKLFTTTGIPLGMVFPIACIVLVYTRNLRAPLHRRGEREAKDP
jgi:hypothetical protein